MPTTKISSAIASDLTTAMTDFSVDTKSTDAAFDQPETRWMNENWPQYFGYYKAIPELGAAIDAKATWTVGKGFKAEPEVEAILNKIRGWGKDTFNTIIENMIRTYNIGGDAFCEIIKDGELINLKPLDPGVMVIVVNPQGIIIGYEQNSKVAGKEPKKFKPEEIFHLARNRVADEIHGVSIIERLETIILMRNQAMDDWKRVLHRNIDPMMIFHLDTDNTAEITAFKSKTDAARGKGENMYIPKDAVVPEQISIAPNAALNPLQWIESLNDYFYEACGTPRIILGNSRNFTEASAKIVYLAFQQTIEEEQLFVEEEVLQQLGLVIELEFPVSLEADLLTDESKDGDMKETKKSETTAGKGQ